MKRYKLINCSRKIGETAEGKAKYISNCIGAILKHDNGALELKLDYLPADMSNCRIFINALEEKKEEAL